MSSATNKTVKLGEGLAKLMANMRSPSPEPENETPIESASFIESVVNEPTAEIIEIPDTTPVDAEIVAGALASFIEEAIADGALEMVDNDTPIEVTAPLSEEEIAEWEEKVIKENSEESTDVVVLDEKTSKVFGEQDMGKLAAAIDIVRGEVASRYGVAFVTADDISLIVNERSFIDKLLIGIFSGLDVPLQSMDYATRDIRLLPVTRKVLGANLLSFNEMNSAAAHAIANFKQMKIRAVNAENDHAQMKQDYEMLIARGEKILREANAKLQDANTFAAEQKRAVDAFMAPASESPFLLRASYSLTRNAPDAKKTEYQDKRRTYYIASKEPKGDSGLYKTPSLTVTTDFAKAIRFDTAKEALAQIERIKKFVVKNDNHAFADKRGKNILKHLYAAKIGFDIYSA